MRWHVTQFSWSVYTLRDPRHAFSAKIQCEAPPDGLNDQQLFALHEFFHLVAAAGYKLYQTVPRELAAQVIKQKFEVFIKAASAKEDPETL